MKTLIQRIAAFDDAYPHIADYLDRRLAQVAYNRMAPQNPQQAANALPTVSPESYQLLQEMQRLDAAYRSALEELEARILHLEQAFRSLKNNEGQLQIST